MEINEASNVARIQRTVQEKNALMGFTEDGESQFLDENVRHRIESHTQQLFAVAFDIEVKSNDLEFTKQLSQDTLPMLNEIECTLNRYLEKFSEFE